MTRFVLRWLISALAIFMLPNLIEGIAVENFAAALAAAAVLSLLNWIVRPILVFLTFPFTLVTLGLFLFVINAIVFQIMGTLVTGIYIDSFVSALFASVAVSLVAWITHWTIDSSSGHRRVVIHHRVEQRPVRDI